VGEQARVLALIPGLEQAEFVRFGMVHRNTYINGPTVLRETWQTQCGPICSSRARFRGRGLRRIGGVWLIAGRNAAALVRGDEPRVPPGRRRLARWRFTCRMRSRRTTQPTNITFGIMEPPPEGKRRGRLERKTALSTRRWRRSTTGSRRLRPARYMSEC
jgi:methylenetetrahydrofolate--tRNA-(uracil-5-)-methyltransferase